MLKYKINLRNQLKALETFLIIAFGLVLVVIYLKEYNSRIYPDIEYDFLIISIPIFLPAIYLHLEYYLKNKGLEIELDSVQKDLTYSYHGGIKVKYDYKDIDKIVIYMAPSLHRGSSFQLLPIEQYHFARVYFKDGEELIISCLMVVRVQDAINNIKGVPIEKVKMLFATLLIK